jgi:hypothetical protein
MCKEWIKRGYKDSLLPKIDSYYKELENVQISSPDIIGNEEFHSSHRAALLYENYEYYKQFQWKETPIGY